MTEAGSITVRHQVILVARILLAALFLLFGWDELTSYSG